MAEFRLGPFCDTKVRVNARNCKLCREEGKDLRNSHLLAKGLYPSDFPRML